jgi:16S rRNA processing protein RimM
VVKVRSTTGNNVCLGAIVGAHGVRGEVRVQSFTARPADLVAYGPLTDEAGKGTFAIMLVGESRGQLIARVAGVADRNAAESLAGLRLYVACSALPSTAENEFYHGDLIGLRAVNVDGGEIGIVRAIHDFGAGDVIALERADGEEVLLAFTRANFPVVDIAGGRLVVDPPIEVEAVPEAPNDAPVEEVRP